MKVQKYVRHGKNSTDSFGSTTDGAVLSSKTGRREVPGSNFGRAYRLSCWEFSVVFSETHVNTPLERALRRASHP